MITSLICVEEATAKNGLGGAAAGARSAEPCAHARKAFANPCDALAIGQHRDRLARDGLRRELVLHELRHDAVAGNQVDHADGVELTRRRSRRYESGDTR